MDSVKSEGMQMLCDTFHEDFWALVEAEDGERHAKILNIQ